MGLGWHMPKTHCCAGCDVYNETRLHDDKQNETVVYIINIFIYLLLFALKLLNVHISLWKLLFDLFSSNVQYNTNTYNMVDKNELFFSLFLV